MIYRLPRPFKRGDTFRLPFNVKDSNGAAVDISGWTITSQMRAIDDTVVATFTINLINGGTGGQAEIYAAPVATSAWSVGAHMMDVEVLDGNGDVYSTADIQVQVTEGPTRV